MEKDKKENLPTELKLPWQVFQYGHSDEFVRGYLSARENNIILSLDTSVEIEDLPF